MGNLSTPKSVQKLQTALHAKAKAEAGYRFYALYDKISREDILAHAYAQCRSNIGLGQQDQHTRSGAGRNGHCSNCNCVLLKVAGDDRGSEKIFSQSGRTYCFYYIIFDNAPQDTLHQRALNLCLENPD